MMKPKHLKTLRDYLIGWFMAMMVWELLRNTDLISVETSESPVYERVVIFIFSWLSQGLLFGLLNVFIDHYLSYRIPFIKLVISALALQLIVAVVIVVLLYYVLIFIGILKLPETLGEFILLPFIPVAFVYAMLVNFSISLLIYINMMLGSGNLLKIIKGQFYTPKVDERIFMFLDLRGSTTLAENLGHILYSELIQDCFYDLAVVHDYKASIYQYVGDEAVLVWPKEDGKVAMNCIRAFFAFKNRLNERSEYYQRTYHTIPEFKGGLNFGEITTAEVGDLKREIAYHGDTINTAARLQGECNRLGADLLVSEALLAELQLESWVKPELKGQIQLKGKQDKINVYAIEIADEFVIARSPASV